MAGPAGTWRAPPGWPAPPAGWAPPPGWQPPADWPPPPPGWQFWEPPPAPAAVPGPSTSPPLLELTSRRAVVVETWLVMLAFLPTVVISAVILFVQHVQGVSDITRFPTFVPHDPVANMILGIVDYAAVGSLVPLTLFLLARTGQRPAALGLGRPKLLADVWPGLGLAVLAFLTEWVILIPFAPLLEHNTKLVNPVPTGHVPDYYVVWGIAISAVTAVTEEVIVNGYLITRLEQLGWSPQRALALSLVLRTSYHVYYGLGFLLTIPFGYFVTRSFQKWHRLNRSIAAHFIYDAVLTTIAILT